MPKRFRRLKNPLKMLIGKTVSTRHIPVEEIEERAETRQDFDNINWIKRLDPKDV